MATSVLLDALARTSSELEYWESVDSRWLHIWTGMVVVGVALELGVIFFDFLEDLHASIFEIIRSPERPSLKKLIFEVFACALVVVGVAGEFFVARATENIGTELRIISNERVGIAEEEAGIANKEAGYARRETKTLERSNKLLEIDLESEKQKTASANTRLSAEQAKLQEALQATADAQKQNAETQRKLNESLVTRILARTPPPTFVEDLKKIGPRRAEVWYRDGDEEARWFAILIRNALAEAGWDVPRDLVAVPASRFSTGNAVPTPGAYPPVGTTISLRDLPLPDAKEYMLYLSESPDLLMRGVDSRELRRDSSLPHNFLRIVVGTRDPTR